MDGSPSYFDARGNTLHVHRDVFFGPYAGYVGAVGFVMAYFALITWIGKGRTPGKWLFGLGFLEARWDANRQALHDKVARTVMLREPRSTQSATHEEEDEAG